MKPFYPAIIPPSEMKRAALDLATKWREGHQAIRASFPEATEETIDAITLSATTELARRADETVWKNDKYQVAVRKLDDEHVHLSIKRIDRQTIHDWRELQEIKNQLVGPECEGLELYPAESRVVDQANQYHIFCCTVVGYKFPFGFNDGRLVSNDSIAGSMQRPREDA